MLIAGLSLFVAAPASAVWIGPPFGAMIRDARCDIEGWSPRATHQFMGHRAPNGDLVVGTYDQPSLVALPPADRWDIALAYRVNQPYFSKRFLMVWALRSGVETITLLDWNGIEFDQAYQFDVTQGGPNPDCRLGEPILSGWGYPGPRTMEVCRRGNNFVRLRRITFQQAGGGVPLLGVQTVFDSFVAPGQNVLEVFELDGNAHQLVARTASEIRWIHPTSLTTAAELVFPGGGFPTGSAGLGGYLIREDPSTGNVAPVEISGLSSSSAPNAWRTGAYPAQIDAEYAGSIMGAELTVNGVLQQQLHFPGSGGFQSTARLDFPGRSVEGFAVGGHQSTTIADQRVVVDLSGDRLAVVHVDHVFLAEGGRAEGSFERSFEFDCPENVEPLPEPLPVERILVPMLLGVIFSEPENYPPVEDRTDR